MALALPRCEEMLQVNCLDRFDLVGCQNAQNFCGQHISAPFWAAQLNPCVPCTEATAQDTRLIRLPPLTPRRYDMSMTCTPEQMADSLCYPQTKVIRKYLDQPHIRSLLGVDASLGPFQSCSRSVGNAFNLASDGLGKVSPFRRPVRRIDRAAN